jgi:transposase
MARPLVDDELWSQIAPLLPPPKPRPYGHPGRKPKPDRQVLAGILFVLQTGIPWEYVPKEMGSGSGMTCWRRLRDWQTAGVWQKIFEVLLAKLQHAKQIDWSRAAIDSSTVRAVGGGEKNGAESYRQGSKRKQASYYNRRVWHSLERWLDPRQYVRQYDTSGNGRQRSARQRRLGTAKKKTRSPIRRPGIRLQTQPRRTEAKKD